MALRIGNMTKNINLKQIDLSKRKGCNLSDISDAKEYMVRYSGHWIYGYFTKQWYGWNFVWFGSAYAGLQLDSLQEVWEVVDKPTELWVGLVHHIKYHASLAKVGNPRMVTQHQDAVGFRGPLVVHLCGTWKELPEWPQIRDALKCAGLEGGIKWVKHYR